MFGRNHVALLAALRVRRGGERPPRSLLTFVLFVALSTGCASESDIVGTLPPLPGFDGEPVRTDTTSYALRPEGMGLATEIAFVYENQTAERLYLVNCNRILTPVLEKRVENGWIPFWTPITPECLSPPIVLRPGASLAYTLPVLGGLPGHNTFPEFASEDVDGVYRIVLHNVVTRYNPDRQGFGDPVALEQRVSNHFTLDDPRQ